MAKLILRYGDVSVEYDGPEAFLKDELPQIVKAVGDLRDIAPPQQGGPSGSAGQISKNSVSTLAQKLAASSGPDLIAAAALSLALGGAPAFTKRQLRDRTREARTFWKKSYANNFDNYVNRLVSAGRLNHTGGDNYAIPENEQSALAARVAAAT